MKEYLEGFGWDTVYLEEALEKKRMLLRKSQSSDVQ
jgi:hypothetical protein